MSGLEVERMWCYREDIPATDTGGPSPADIAEDARRREEWAVELAEIEERDRIFMRTERSRREF